MSTTPHDPALTLIITEPDDADPPSVADVMAERCVLRPGETADSGGSGPGITDHHGKSRARFG